MGLRYGFFNSVNGDRKYNAEDMTKYFDKIISDGVFHDPANALNVTASITSSMTLSVLPGRGIIKCHWLENDAAYNITIDESDVVLDRIDAVVMRLDERESARKMEIAIIKGTPSSNPVAPDLTSDPLVKELVLAYVRVNHGVNAITQDDITDTRPDESLCGWVHSLVASGAAGTLKKYQSYQVLQEDTSTVKVNISQFTSSSVLQVYVGGILLVEGLEYSVDGVGADATINLVNSVRAGNTIVCTAMRIE